MSHVPSAQYAQITHIFSGDALRHQANVTYGVSYGSTIDPAVLAALADGWWSTNVLPQQSYKVSMLGTHVKVGPDDTGPFADFSDPGVGGLASEAESSQVSIIAQKVTGVGGRWNRGRMYIPGAASAFVNDGGVLDGSYLTDWGGAMGDFLANIADDSYVMVVLHSLYSTHNKVKVPNPHLASAPAAVTAITVESVVATQRRRLRG